MVGVDKDLRVTLYKPLVKEENSKLDRVIQLPRLIYPAGKYDLHTEVYDYQVFKATIIL